ncbi:unnamed protein product [Acanthoscelides obtectus]|uniref:Uncharacterized protein n=1 Tax=Acanthoscelides obtectus TaxID=200917 RepID=A0A9P0PRE7_ACAOB|nr:unnamed protein product [Acanthoscelides obtectus]CAK1635959.1 hypothetical protein AOBTE_LOCUS9652 [Acanthoscelides obtectus]
MSVSENNKLLRFGKTLKKNIFCDSDHCEAWCLGKPVWLLVIVSGVKSARCFIVQCRENSPANEVLQNGAFPSGLSSDHSDLGQFQSQAHAQL